MNNIINQMLYSLKRVMLDTKSLISKMLTFLLIILVLGASFKNAFETKELERQRVGYLNLDKGPHGKEVLDILTQAEGVKNWIDFVEVSSFEEGQSLAGDTDVDDDRKIAAMVYIPEDFSETYESPERNVLSVYRGKNSQISGTIVQCVIDTFVNTMNTVTVLDEEFNTSLSDAYNIEGGMEEAPVAKQETPSAMGYYAVAMLMMALIYGMQYGCEGVGEEYLGTIGEKIKTTPLKPYQQYIGKVIGLCLASVVQGIFIILVTKIAYGVNWGDSYLFILLVVFAMSCASTAIGALACILTGSVEKGDSIITLLVIVFTFLAGGFVKMDTGDIKYISPNFYGQNAIFNSVYDGDMVQAYKYVGILFVFAIVAGVFAVMLSRRKKA